MESNESLWLPGDETLTDNFTPYIILLPFTPRTRLMHYTLYHEIRVNFTNGIFRMHFSRQYDRLKVEFVPWWNISVASNYRPFSLLYVYYDVIYKQYVRV